MILSDIGMKHNFVDLQKLLIILYYIRHLSRIRKFKLVSKNHAGKLIHAVYALEEP